MSLGVIIKAPEGMVLAADSRVTLMVSNRQTNITIPTHFDNATKLLKVNGQDHVGVITYGLGAIGAREPRTAHSFMPEFEAELYRDRGSDGESLGRIDVEDFGSRLGDFFMRQWDSAKMPRDGSVEDMVFYIGGYDESEPYGKVFQISIPSSPVPVEQNPNTFGISIGGQRGLVARLFQGFDSALRDIAGDFLNLGQQERNDLYEHLQRKLALPIPYQFLPLQDCVDLSIFLIRATITLQGFSGGVRGVGGAIDVATITRPQGFSVVQSKVITGERVTYEEHIGGL